MTKYFLASRQLPGRNFLLLVIRIWFGLVMMNNGKFIFDKTNIPFFQHWFGVELHFPAPILLFYLAKGSEFFGGFLLLSGFLTRIGSSLVAFTMLVATMTANKGNMFVMDGTITFAFMSISLWFLFYGPGKWSLDYFLFDIKYNRKKQNAKSELQQSPDK